MTVTPEQWAAAAADLNITMDELQANIDKVERLNEIASLDPQARAPLPYFDRDGDPLTLGEWAVLFEAPSYKMVKRTLLSNRYWVATIWTGVNNDFDDPPTMLESSVFRVELGTKLNANRLCTILHTDMTAALQSHEELVLQYARA